MLSELKLRHYDARDYSRASLYNIKGIFHFSFLIPSPYDLSNFKHVIHHLRIIPYSMSIVLSREISSTLEIKISLLTSSDGPGCGPGGAEPGSPSSDSNGFELIINLKGFES